MQIFLTQNFKFRIEDFEAFQRRGNPEYNCSITAVDGPAVGEFNIVIFLIRTEQVFLYPFKLHINPQPILLYFLAVTC